MEQKVSKMIKEEAETRKHSESRLLESIEEKTDIIKDEIMRESENREQNIHKLLEYKENDVPRIEDGIKTLIAEREEMEQALLKQTGDEFDKIRDLMNEEQRAWDESEDTISNALKELSG